MPAEHTPGPWTFEDGYIIANGEALKMIGIQIPMVAGPSRLEAIANARIAAAALEMLEALRSINMVASPNPQRTFDDVIRDLNYITDRARSALSKAEAPHA
jgi:hypothetical protein